MGAQEKNALHALSMGDGAERLPGATMPARSGDVNGV
jgi:hypothetical protein